MLDSGLITSGSFIGAIALYAAASALIAKYIRSDSDAKTIQIGSALGWAATVLHLIYAATTSFDDGVLNFNLRSMTVLVSGLLVMVYVLGSLVMPIRRLGVLVFPLTILSLLFSLVWSSENVQLSTNSPAASAHIMISIMAYCLLAIATVQAILYVYQERQIKNRTTPAMLMALPPLQTMEQLLFRLISVGFALLTLTLVSGAFFSQQIFGHAFEFKHHTILASMGWLVFAVLLLKRLIQGLRGSQAVYWTIGGFALIQLGYFGTKIVSETLALQ